MKSIPPIVEEITQIFNEVQEFITIKLKGGNINVNSFESIPSPFKNVLLYSGGKDSTYMYLHLREKFKKSELALVYAHGPTINGEFLLEREAVNKIKRLYNPNLFVIESYYVDYGPFGLNTKFRTLWRNFILMILGRMFSSTMWFGEYYDFRTIHARDITDIRGMPRVWLSLSQVPFIIQRIEKAINAKINFFRNLEINTLETIIKNNPSLLDIVFTCLNPLGPCNVPDEWETACGKCKTRYVNKKIIEGENLTEREIKFLLSPDWVGDSILPMIYRKSGYKGLKKYIMNFSANVK